MITIENIKDETGNKANPNQIFLKKAELRTMPINIGSILVAGTVEAVVEDIYYLSTHGCLMVKVTGQKAIDLKRIVAMINAGQIVVK